MRFEVIPTLSGAEIFDNVAGRVIDHAPSKRRAHQLAAELDELATRQTDAVALAGTSTL